jgi:hypothetical protein
MVRLLQAAIAVQAAAVLLFLGGIIGLIAFSLGIFAAFELALWADFHWPDASH